MLEQNNSSKKSINKIKLLFEIFITFFVISPVTFGGGFAMIPVLERAVVGKKRWINEKEIVDIFAVSQSIPGAIAVNFAIYLGYRLAGIPGALAAMFGIVMPTFFIIIILTIALASFQNNSDIQAALKGIKPVIVALIIYAGYKMSKSALFDGIGWILAAVSLVLLLLFKSMNIFFLILAGAIGGIAIIKIKDKIAKMKKGYGNEEQSKKDENL